MESEATPQRRQEEELNDAKTLEEPAVLAAVTTPEENQTCKVGGVTMSRDDAAQLMTSMMNTESHGTKNTWYDTNENDDEIDDPVERDLCKPTAGVKVGLTSRYIFVVNIAGNVIRWDVLKVFLRCLLFALFLVCLWLALGDLAQPGGAVFAIITTILFGSLVGMMIAKITGFPPLIGFLLAGLIWASTSWNTGVPQLFYSSVRTIALTTILCRAGINFKWSSVKPVALQLALTGMVPQISEGIVHAVLAKQFFPHSSWLTAILQGAVVAPASSAIVITVLYPLRAAGYSVSRGPCLLMYVCAAADSVFAVWLINFILGIMYPTPGAVLPLWQRIALAPLQIVLGFVIGVIGGKIIVLYSNMYFKRNEGLTGGWRDVAEKHSKRDTALFVLLSQMALILLANKINIPGAGTVAAAVAAATISQTWLNQGLEERKNELNHTLADMWDDVIAPTLFSLVGASVNMKAVMSADFLPPALICIFGGVLFKCIVVMLLQTGTGLMFKEKVFFAIGFCAKSTVQAAMCGKFLDYATNKWSQRGPEEAATAEAEIALARTVQQVAVCALAICAIISGVTMKVTSSSLLMKDEDYFAMIEKEKQEKDK